MFDEAKKPAEGRGGHPAVGRSGGTGRGCGCGLFLVYHGVGSEEWSADGFTLLAARQPSRPRAT
jgi:hypothetical protein